MKRPAAAPKKTLPKKKADPDTPRIETGASESDGAAAEGTESQSSKPDEGSTAAVTAEAKAKAKAKGSAKAAGMKPTPKPKPKAKGKSKGEVKARPACKKENADEGQRCLLLCWDLESK